MAFCHGVYPKPRVQAVVTASCFNTFCVLCSVKFNEQKKENKNHAYNKEAGEFPNQSRFINYDNTRRVLNTTMSKGNMMKSLKTISSSHNTVN